MLLAAEKAWKSENTHLRWSCPNRTRQKNVFPKIYDMGSRTKSENKRAVTRGRRRRFNVLTLFPSPSMEHSCPIMLHCYKGISNSPSVVASEITTPVPLHWAIFRGRLPRGEILDKPPQPQPERRAQQWCCRWPPPGQ